MTPPQPPTPPPSLKTSKKWVSSGGGLGGSGPKTHWGMRLLDKIMILQGVKLTIQPLGVGYANRPKKAKMGGYVAFSPYIRLPGFDLTTSARGFWLKKVVSTKNSIAFGKSTSQRIYREQHTPKKGWKLHKYRLKHALHTLDDHFR